MPVAVLFLLGFPRLTPRRVFLGCVAASAFIETAQLVLPGRHTSLRDLALNSAGAGLGTLVGVFLRRQLLLAPVR